MVAEAAAQAPGEGEAGNGPEDRQRGRHGGQAAGHHIALGTVGVKRHVFVDHVGDAQGGEVVGAVNGERATIAAMPKCSRQAASGQSQPSSQRWASSGAQIAPSSNP